MMKIIRFFKLHKILKERMAVIDETMNLKKAIDVYSECICKMHHWPVDIIGSYSMYFCEIGFSFMNGYIKSLRDNGFCFKKGLVKPIDPEADIPCGALGSYNDKLRDEFNDKAVSALREVIKEYEPDSVINQNTIVSAFEERLKNEKS